MTDKLEDDVRAAAAKLQDAIGKAEAGGYTVTLPRRASDLSGIVVSATARQIATVQVAVPAEADADTTDKAAAAAQKAADRVTGGIATPATPTV